ncbi:MAG TPA: hypothetical protein PKC43_11585 [Phycisphaerales bacterium]|nr:hypothetical protein [Phycisphaerales bacterium]HMP38074.1 hypothetical protein [Phycisphaerales bacterium]
MPHPSPRAIRVALVLFAAYLLAATLAIYALQYREHAAKGGIYALHFGFGPLARSLVEEGCYAVPAEGYSLPTPEETWSFTAHRMPLVPILLAAVAFIRNSVLLALLVKNACFGAIFAAGALRLWRACANAPGALLLGALFAATFPSLVLFSLLLEVEEGYLVATIFFLFAHLVRCGDEELPIGGWRWTAIALANMSLFLTKASMWPLMVMNVLFFACFARSLRAGAGLGAAALVSFGLWAGHNLHHSGRFTIANTWASWCLYKGNNPRTAEIYPAWTVDRMDHEGIVESPLRFEDEWAYEAHNKAQAKAFILENPAEFMKLTAIRTRVFLLSVRNTPWLPERDAGALRRAIDLANVGWMVAFRALFAVVTLRTLWAVLRLRRDPAERRIAALGICFLLFVGAYAAAYIVGFGYQRHVMPIVPPTIACAVAFLSLRRAPLPQG